MFDGVIETRYGKVRGVEEDGLWVYRGVRYAAAPSGVLRFRAPQPPERWTGVRDADRPGPIAPQLRDGIGSYVPGDPQEQGEDCLSLNLWTLGPTRALLPVMCFVHGGAFLAGSGSGVMYSGAALARRAVVVVTIGYRLGALGFLAHPGLFDPETGGFGNWGLADQLAALAWVQQNVEAFGGDPAKVTIFGESAGAMSAVDLLAVGWPGERRLLFHRVLAESGGAVATSAVAARAVAESLGRELGLGEVSRTALEGISVEEILGAQKRLVATVDEGIGMPFQPVVDAGLLRVHPSVAIARGASAGIDLVVGTNRDEFRLFAFALEGLEHLDEAELESIVARYLRGSGLSPERLGAGDVLELYRGARAERGAPTKPRDLLEAIATDWLFVAPAARLAAAHTASGGRAFRYRFDWESPFMGGALGACHGIELPFVFGTLDHHFVGLFSGTGEDASRLSDAVQAAWVAFASSGDPSCPELGTWPPYADPARAVMVLERDPHVELDPSGAELIFWDERLGRYGAGGPIEGAAPGSVAFLASADHDELDEMGGKEVSD